VDIHINYNSVNLLFHYGLCAAEAQLIVFHEQIEKLEAAKKGLVSDLKTIEQKESELVKTLQEKYNEGNINIETGEITPIQQ